MYVFNYDPTTGASRGGSPAEFSPLEPGVLLVPAFSTDVPPPKLGDGEYARFIPTFDGIPGSGEWVVEPIPKDEAGVAQEAAILTEAERQDLRRAVINDHLASAQRILDELRAQIGE